MTKDLDFETLVDRGWIEVPEYFNSNIVAGLLAQSKELAQEGHFRPAGISSTKTVNSKIRSDFIHWVEDWQASPAIDAYRQEILSIGAQLSQELRVSLKTFEGHLSHYGPGNFYLKHIDQHREQRHRQVTLVTYLNDCEGGELGIFSREDRNRLESLVRPESGKLVLFLSGFIFHEVRETKSERYGLTGWFRDEADLFGAGLSL